VVWIARRRPLLPADKTSALAVQNKGQIRRPLCRGL